MEGEIITTPIHEAVAHTMIAGGFGPGDQIVRDEVLKQMGVIIPESGTRREIEKATLRALTMFKAFTDFMLVHYKLWLRAERREGVYTAENPSDQTREAERAMRRDLKKSIRDATSRITHVRVDLLTNDERAYRDKTLVRTGFLAAMVLAKDLINLPETPPQIGE